MVYIHVPFCRSFCTYCDFYSEIACKGGDSAAFSRWLEGVEAEAAARRDEIDAASTPRTLYVGGGTPSVLPPGFIARLAEAAGSGPWDEFTVEVNPEDIVSRGEDYVRELKDSGVTRVSMGVQSLDDGILKWMNRRHDAARALEAFRLLRRGGFANISVDVIFGLSQMEDSVLERTLSEIIALGPEHVSAYQLSIEEGSSLDGMVRDGRYREASDEQCRRQYEMICGMLRDAGYRHYEISNWAKPGFEAVHNSAYWTRKPYVGLGPGAHSLRRSAPGREPDVRSWNSQELSGWTSESETLGPGEIHEERLMLGLRTAEGVDGKVIEEKDWFISDSIISELV